MNLIPQPNDARGTSQLVGDIKGIPNGFGYVETAAIRQGCKALRD
jgi:hypothetical protein